MARPSRRPIGGAFRAAELLDDLQIFGSEGNAAQGSELEDDMGGLDEFGVVIGAVVFETDGNGGEGGMVPVAAEVGGDDIVGDWIVRHLVFSFEIVFGVEEVEVIAVALAEGFEADDLTAGGDELTFEFLSEDFLGGSFAHGFDGGQIDSRTAFKAAF